MACVFDAVRRAGLRILAASAFAAGAGVVPHMAQAAELRVAVAANYTEVARQIGAMFDKASGNKTVFSFGSTGQLYAQIKQGAPFEVFLAADAKTPAKAVTEGLAEPGTAFTYATGKLVLYSADAKRAVGEAALKKADFNKIAIANPVTAPYGTAAVEVMKKLGIYGALEPKIVQGNNIAQTFQFVSTGNAQLGFVALSQVATRQGGSRWIVPDGLYTTIAQDAVLLKKGAGSKAAKDFLQFLKSPQARDVAKKFGYGFKD